MRYTELQEEKLPGNMQYDQESNLTNADEQGPRSMNDGETAE